MKKIDFSQVDDVFIEAIKTQADERGAKPEEITLILFPFDKRGKGEFVTRVKIFSLTNSFPEEIVRLKKVTMYDVLGHISKAILEVFKGEVYDHNARLASGTGESVKAYPHQITMDKLECYIQVAPIADEKYSLTMAMIYDGNFLRNYDMVKEFGDADLDEIQKEMN